MLKIVACSLSIWKLLGPLGKLNPQCFYFTYLENFFLCVFVLFRTKIRLGTMRLQVRSLALISGLRI